MQHCCMNESICITLCMNRTLPNNTSLDNWGIGISIACAIHCAAIPILLISSAYLGLYTERLEQMELPLFILAGIISSLSIFQVYLRYKNVKPLISLILGLLLIIAGGMTDHDSYETILRVMGSSFIVLGHVMNKKTLKRQST